MRPTWVGSMEAALKGYPMPEGFALVDTDQILHLATIVDEQGGCGAGWFAYIAETGRAEPLVACFRVEAGITGMKARQLIDDTIAGLKREREKRDAEEADETRTRNP